MCFSFNGTFGKIWCFRSILWTGTFCVLRWCFNNVSGLGENDNYVVDVSGYRNNVTSNNAYLNCSGRYGGAIAVNGTNYVNVGSDTSLYMNGTFTISSSV